MKHWVAFVTAFSLGALCATNAARAHCDTATGPVVSAARQALESGNVNLVLVWVRRNDETEVRQLFDQVRAVRLRGDEAARDLADRLFYETAVRLHRVGEGNVYAGIKPSGTAEPAVVAVDRSIANGRLVGVSKLISGQIEQALREQFDALMAKKRYDPGDIAAGRVYARAYVEFVHYVDRLYAAAEALSPERAAPQTAEAEPHAH